MGVRLLFFWLFSTSVIGSAAIPALAFAAVPAGGRDLLAPAPSPSITPTTTPPTTTPTTAGPAEARRVYCLSRDQWPKLVDALGALGLAARPTPAPSGSPPVGADQIVVNGQNTDLLRWSAEHPGEFARACDAVLGAAALPRRNEQDGPLVALAKVLLPAIAGGVLTIFATEWRAAIDRGRGQGHTLRELTDEYMSAIGGYLAAARRGTAVPGEALENAVTTAASGLSKYLREQAARHPGWRRMPRLSGFVAADGAQTAALLGDWASYQGSQQAGRRQQRVAEIERRLAEAGKDLGAVAYALEHPWRPHLLMWLYPGRAT